MSVTSRGRAGHRFANFKTGALNHSATLPAQAQVKTKYESKNFFRMNQNIRPLA
jgi:hypothetical protein